MSFETKKQKALIRCRIKTTFRISICEIKQVAWRKGEV